MIGWFKRVLGRTNEYVDDELAWSERRAGQDDAAPRRATGDSAGMRELRGTVDALRNVGQVKAPRSFALTEENLAAAGYSDQEIRRVLNPGMRRVPLWQRPVLRQLPLAVTALALLIGGYFILDDIDVLMPDQSADSSVQVTVEAQVAPAATAQAAPTAEIGVTTAAFTARDGVTVVVERETLIVGTVEMEVSEGDITVVVERQVQLMEDLVTVQLEVMREVEVAAETIQTPESGIVVTREAQIDVARDTDSQTAEAAVAVAPTPTARPAAVVATARPVPTVAADPSAAETAVVQQEPSATPAPLAITEIAVPVPPTELSGPSESVTPRPGAADPPRIWPSAVALALALAGLVVWFELRRRRKLWE